MIRQTKGEKIFNIINIIILCALVVIMVYPCLHVLFASLSDSSELMKSGGFLLYPKGFTLDAYLEVFKNQLIWSGYGNTILNLVLALAFNISLTTLGAYALSRKELMVRRPIMLMIIFTMFFSGGLIPNYILVRNLGMVDTRWALFIPTAISAYNLIIMRTSFESIPDTLIEAAKLDGASHIQLFRHVAMPLVKSSVLSLTLIAFLNSWNDFVWPMLTLSANKNLKTITLGLYAYRDVQQILYGPMFAGFFMASIPLLVLFCFNMRYFISGITSGAVKG